MEKLLIALAVAAAPASAAAQEAAEQPLREVQIHNHTDQTIARLSLRRLTNAPAPVEEPALVLTAEDEALELEDAAAWEDVLDETGAQQVLETHTHLGVSWSAEECWAEFKAEMADGSAELGSVDACTDKQLQFGSQFDHE